MALIRRLNQPFVPTVDQVQKYVSARVPVGGCVATKIKDKRIALDMQTTSGTSIAPR